MMSKLNNGTAKEFKVVDEQDDKVVYSSKEAVLEVSYFELEDVRLRSKIAEKIYSEQL